MPQAQSKTKRFLDDKSEFLVRRYGRYIDSAAEIYKQTKGKQMTPQMRKNLAVTLENTNELVQKKRAMDAMFSSDVSFTNYAFDIVSVVLPSLITEEIVSVQAMDRRSADIFFMNYLADRTKGQIQKGDVLMSSRTGWKPNWGTGAYASGWINGERLTAGTDGQLEFGTLVQDFNVTLNIYTDDKYETISATHTNKVEGGSVTVGTLSIDTVTGEITGVIAPFSTLTYKVDLEQTRNAIGRIKVEIVSEVIKAKTMKLNAEWLMDAAYDLQKAHGRDAEKEILIALTGEVRAEIDTGVIMDLLNLASANNADGSVVKWEKTPDENIQWWFWRQQIIDTFINQSTNIYNTTRRALGNFLVLGTAVSDVVTSLDQFKSAVTVNMEFTGPYYAGELSNRWKVYISPDIPANEWFQGYVGESYLKSGYVYAPYLPIFTTQTREFEDFTLAKGLGSSYGTFPINSGLYSRGEMTIKQP